MPMHAAHIALRTYGDVPTSSGIVSLPARYKTDLAVQSAGRGFPMSAKYVLRLNGSC